MFKAKQTAVTGGGASFQNSQSLAFDGTNDYVSVGSTFQSTLRDDVSFSIWVKPTDGRPDGTTHMIFGSNDNDADIIYLAILSTGKVRYYFESDGYFDLLDSTNPVFSDGQNDWTHLAITSEKNTSKGFKLYVNGESNTSANSTGINDTQWGDFTTNYNFLIGAYNDEGTAALPFTGGMTDFAVYNTILTPNEVKTIYNNRQAFDHKNWITGARSLVSWLKLGDGTLDRWGRNTDASFNSFLIADEVNPTIGNNVILNGGFASGSGWTLGNGWSIGSGVATRASGESSNSVIEYAGDVITADKTYKYSFDFNIASGNCSAFIGGTSLDSSFNGSGTNSGYVTAAGGGEFSLYGLTNAEVTSIDNVQAWLVGGAAGTTVNMDEADIVGDIP